MVNLRKEVERASEKSREELEESSKEMTAKLLQTAKHHQKLITANNGKILEGSILFKIFIKSSINNILSFKKMNPIFIN